nr:hypothetical protein [Marinomonas sp. IMCC 4694]
MLANLSFRTKLLSLLIAAILGFVVVTAVALQGLSVQEASSSKFERLTSVDKHLATLSLTLMEQYESLTAIDDSSYEDFLVQLEASDISFIGTLNKDIAILVDPEAKNNTQNISDALVVYNEALKQLVNQRQKSRL